MITQLIFNKDCKG